MEIPELIANARECATDALTLLSVVNQVVDPRIKFELLCRATALLHTGSEEAHSAQEMARPAQSLPTTQPPAIRP